MEDCHTVKRGSELYLREARQRIEKAGGRLRFPGRRSPTNISRSPFESAPWIDDEPICSILATGSTRRIFADNWSKSSRARG